MGKREETGREVSRQIAVHKSKSSLLELNNCMRPASRLFPWHMHAEGREDEAGASLIRLVMVGYGSKEDHVSVYANVLPEHIKYFYTQMANGVEEFSFAQQKIFRESADTREGKVTCFSISRHEYNGKGEKRNYPWYVEIQNGTGLVERARTGGQHCKKGSYRVQKKVTIYLTDMDIFVLFSRANSVILAFERDTLFHFRDIQNFQMLFKKLAAFFSGRKGEEDIAA